MRDKIHQNPPSMRDFLYKTNPIQVFCCNFAASNIEKDKSGMSIRGVKNRFVVVRFVLRLFRKGMNIYMFNK